MIVNNLQVVGSDKDEKMLPPFSVSFKDLTTVEGMRSKERVSD